MITLDGKESNRSQPVLFIFMHLREKIQLGRNVYQNVIVVIFADACYLLIILILSLSKFIMEILMHNTNS